MNEINLDAVYRVLVAAARRRNPITYTQLSEGYEEEAGEWHEPHGTWDEPLGELNRTLHGVGWPALSAVVYSHLSNEPGGRFWESSPNIPARPGNDLTRAELWTNILNGVYAVPWPDQMPVHPPA